MMDAYRSARDEQKHTAITAEGRQRAHEAIAPASRDVPGSNTEVRARAKASAHPPEIPDDHELQRRSSTRAAISWPIRLLQRR